MVSLQVAVLSEFSEIRALQLDSGFVMGITNRFH